MPALTFQFFGHVLRLENIRLLGAQADLELFRKPVMTILDTQAFDAFIYV